MSSGIDMASSFPCTYNSSNNKPDTLLRGVQRASHGDKRQACVHQLFFFFLWARGLRIIGYLCFGAGSDQVPGSAHSCSTRCLPIHPRSRLGTNQGWPSDGKAQTLQNVANLLPRMVGRTSWKILS